jgi:hypothetical protein
MSVDNKMVLKIAAHWTKQESVNNARDVHESAENCGTV